MCRNTLIILRYLREQRLDDGYEKGGGSNEKGEEVKVG